MAYLFTFKIVKAYIIIELETMRGGYNEDTPFPIILALKILEFIFKLTGRLISMCIGLVLLIVGFFLCLTIIVLY